ncbi:MAG: flagellar hook-associated protein FlgK [Candidatus Goldiibacteriota bacterium HGW-Goldbacteria-1]|jgi:flagellar hook-associated protein 1 FlgK|nr:MAG: flagellar hook-associated protein FlgK [Candidatus Goldiibacteriota bacterium HGW-Goldbacteria-1]
MSVLIGLEAALKSMRASTTAINTASHNIANMNTEGYSKQAANISATQPLNNPNGAGQLGTGSAVTYIQRIRNLYLDTQIRSEISNLGKAEVLSDVYKNIMALFPEVNNASIPGVTYQLEQFWQGWEDLAVEYTKPVADQDIASINNRIYAAAQNLSELVSTKASSLNAMQIGLNSTLRTAVDEANTYLEEIASYNRTIMRSQGTGQIPNDIFDKRELALQKLSELMNVSTAESTDGALIVLVNGIDVVSGGNARTISTIKGNSKSGMDDIAIGTFNITDSISSGKIAGILEARDVVVQQFLTDLDILASGMISVVNRVHRTGVDSVTGLQGNRNFFEGTRAVDFRVSEDIEDISMISGTKYQPGDIAAIMANLDNKLMNNYISSSKVMAVSSTTTLGSTGSLVINNIEVKFDAADTVADLIQKINVNVQEVSAVFDDSNHTFYISAARQIIIEELNAGGNAVVPPPLLTMFKLFQEQVSAAPVNYGKLISGPDVVTDLLGSPPSIEQRPNFSIDPGVGGTLTIQFENQTYDINWNEGQQINLIAMNIGYIDNAGTNPNLFLATFRDKDQRMYLSSNINSWGTGNAITPFVITDKDGSFAKAMNLIKPLSAENQIESMFGGLKANYESALNAQSQYKTTAEALQGMQSEVTAVDENAELAKAKLYQRSYDASVRLMAVIDQMLNMLINRMGTPSSDIQ